MAFPAQRPTSRDFSPGDWPVKQYNSQSGVEIRVLYGSQRTKMTLNLAYENITDAQADEFLTHYRETQGTYNTFLLPAAAKAGWTGNASAIDAAGYGNRWRYNGPPQIKSVKPGRSSVQVELIGVL
jgi:hypothetical protein